MNRLDQQLSFVLEIDKLKTILRQTLLTDSSRRENSAEHSWHLAIMSFLLAEYATEPVDVPRVIKMLLVHDLIEIDAGDTFAYDVAGNIGQGRTRAARCPSASSVCCPRSRRRELRALWEEFEEFKTRGIEIRQRARPSSAVAAQLAHGGRHLAHPFRGSRSGLPAHGAHPHGAAGNLAGGDPHHRGCLRAGLDRYITFVAGERQATRNCWLRRYCIRGNYPTSAQRRGGTWGTRHAMCDGKSEVRCHPERAQRVEGPLNVPLWFDRVFRPVPLNMTAR